MQVSEYSDLYFFSDKNIVVLDGFWQYPAKTECAAYESVLRHSNVDDNSIYIAYPWATLIDGVRNNKKDVSNLLIELHYLKKFLIKLKLLGCKKNIVTVCQHILMLEFIKFFEYVGINIVFWSHKINGLNDYFGIQIEPFPLYPAQTDQLIDDLKNISINDYKNILQKNNIKHLVNFVGAYNEKIYLSNVRQCIFNDKNNRGFFVIERKQWHFERLVYSEQILGEKSNYDDIILEQKHKEEYLLAIKHSHFTFCPSGTGPNSIRIYESLCLGSIPVILTNSLFLPGDLELWNKACVIVDDSEKGYQEAKDVILSMQDSEILSKKCYGLELLRVVEPSGYAKLIFG